ncbi:MAG: hypothetical protein PHZ09_05690, partial [Eubacteriales bacterium]|nr:hypothetical protein [Eubacteriales bacterium]
NILRGQGSIICLIKPVYEAGTGEIIEGYDDLYTVLISLTEFFAAEGFSVTGITDSPVRGNGGAIEFFARLLPFAGYTAPGLNGMTEAAVTRSLTLDKFKK